MRWGLTAVCVALPAMARAEPSVRLGGFVGMAFLPGDVELGNSWAPDQVPESGPSIGGRATVWILPAVVGDDQLGLDLGVEGELQLEMSSTGSDPAAGRRSYASPIAGLGAHLIAALETGTSVSPLIVVGGGANAMFTSSPFAKDDLDPIGYWGLGASWQVGRTLALRVDLRQGIEAGRMNDVTSTFAAEIGLSHTFGAVARAPRIDVEPEPDHPPIDTHVVVTPPAPPRDTDGDGIDDAHDKCPGDAEDKDGFQDEDGCPDLDNDGDGFTDAQDKCPNEHETINGYQDEDGCPDTIPAELLALSGTAPAITYTRAKAKLTAPAKKALDRVASTLRKFPDARLHVIGHAGKGVSDDLAHRRAEAVKWYLIDAGVAADRVDTPTSLSDPADSGAARIELIVAPSAK